MPTLPHCGLLQLLSDLPTHNIYPLNPRKLKCGTRPNLDLCEESRRIFFSVFFFFFHLECSALNGSLKMDLCSSEFRLLLKFMFKPLIVFLNNNFQFCLNGWWGKKNISRCCSCFVDTTADFYSKDFIVHLGALHFVTSLLITIRWTGKCGTVNFQAVKFSISLIHMFNR